MVHSNAMPAHTSTRPWQMARRQPKREKQLQSPRPMIQRKISPKPSMACRLTDVAATSKAGSSPLQTLAQLAAQPSTTKALNSPALGSTKTTVRDDFETRLWGQFPGWLWQRDPKTHPHGPGSMGMTYRKAQSADGYVKSALARVIMRQPISTPAVCKMRRITCLKSMRSLLLQARENKVSTELISRMC